MENRDALLSDPSTHALYQTMLRYLVKGDASKGRLRDRITRLKLRYPTTERYKGYTPGRVEIVLQLLEEEDLINEERYAERVFDSLKNKYSGLRLIRQKMLVRKIDPEVVKRIITSFEVEESGGQDLERVIVRAKKKLEILHEKRKGQRGGNVRARQDLYQWLSMRGYSSDEISKILTRVRGN